MSIEKSKENTRTHRKSKSENERVSDVVCEWRERVCVRERERV